MDKKTKQNLLIVIVGIGLFTALRNLHAVLLFPGKGMGIILPIIVGGILALFINVPMMGIEKRLPQWIAYLESLDSDAVWLEEMFADINLEKIMQSVGFGANLFLEGVVNTVSSAASVMITAAFGLIISIYLVLEKEQVCGHIRKVAYAYLKPAWAEYLLHISRTFSKSFANFLSGQCMEAVILGVLMFLAFTIFRLPYGSLIGVLTAVCAIIPYVGAFISGAVSVILALLISPTLAARCLIVYLVVQFVENQFIYPRVVGGSVGLPPLLRSLRP